jgi:uncharacterized protein YutE (UPF0331/DUF86 family)
MPDRVYAKGRIMESLSFITKEMDEFESEYSSKTWTEYAKDNKLQKLIDRTIENILTAFIEVSGVVLTENNIMAENYPDVMKRVGDYLGFNESETDILAKFAIQRNRLAHRYLNFRWEVAKFYIANRTILKKLLNAIYEYEKSKTT